MARNELLSRSFMLMNFAAAALLLMTQRHAALEVDTPVPVVAPVEARISDRTTTPTVQMAIHPAVPTLSLQTQASRPVAVAPARLALPHAPIPALSAFASIEPTELVVDLSDRQVSLYKLGELRATYPIGIGQPGWETPIGTFRVTHLERNPPWQHPITGEVIEPGPDNPLGSRWIGFWSGQEYEIGFHGTNQPGTVGLAISHGCLRMYDADVQELYDQIKVGTSVVVRP